MTHHPRAGDDSLASCRPEENELYVTDQDWAAVIGLFTDFQEFTQITPGAHQERALEVLLNEVIARGQALALLRQLTPTD